MHINSTRFQSIASMGLLVIPDVCSTKQRNCIPNTGQMGVVESDNMSQVAGDMDGGLILARDRRSSCRYANMSVT